MSIAQSKIAASGEKAPFLLRFPAQLVAYLFHPLFITSYVIGFLIFFHPYAFSGFDPRVKVFRWLNVFLCDAAFPLFAVFLLKQLGFIKSMRLHTVKDRILPYIIAMIFYWWTWDVYKNLPDIPVSAIHFLLGAFLALCGGWLCNIYFKVSMHALAAGGALMFFILFSLTDEYASGLYLSVAVLITGLICTSRLLTKDHNAFEIWTGLFVGVLAQWVAWYI